MGEHEPSEREMIVERDAEIRELRAGLTSYKSEADALRADNVRLRMADHDKTHAELRDQIARLRAELERKDAVARRACRIGAVIALGKMQLDRNLAPKEAAAVWDHAAKVHGKGDADSDIDAALAFAESEIPPASQPVEGAALEAVRK
jgi:uncharacterized small protein (DUF1192 family)